MRQVTGYTSMKILSKKMVHSTKFLDMMVTNYMNTKKQLAQWFWVARKGGQKAVVIIAIHEQPVKSEDGEDMEPIRSLVVTKEFRVPVEDYEYGFPAGLIDPGEAPEDAVRRELNEETGLVVDEIMHISPAVISSAGLSNEAVHLAWVRVSGEPSKDKLEASEDIETYLMGRSDVAELLAKDGVVFGKTAYPEMRRFAQTGNI